MSQEQARLIGAIKNNNPEQLKKVIYPTTCEELTRLIRFFSCREAIYPKINVMPDHMSYPPLSNAIINNCSYEILQVLLEAGADPNYAYKSSLQDQITSPLIDGIRQYLNDTFNEYKLNLLFKYAADNINQPLSQNKTAAHQTIALLKEHHNQSIIQPIIQKLYNNGADLQAQDDNGNQPTDYLPDNFKINEALPNIGRVVNDGYYEIRSFPAQ